MMIYGNNTISQKITSNLIRDQNKWLHSSVRHNNRKLQNITIKNGEVEIIPWFWKKNNHDTYQ